MINILAYLLLAYVILLAAMAIAALFASNKPPVREEGNLFVDEAGSLYIVTDDAIDDKWVNFYIVDQDSMLFITKKLLEMLIKQRNMEELEW